MKKIMHLIAALLLLGMAVETASQEKIRVGQGSVSLQSGLMHIAKERGLFAKYGLIPEIVYIPGGTTNIQVLVSGSLDMSQLSGAPGVAANLEGADIIYVLGLLDKLNYQLVTRPEIKSVEQLKGKKLGVSRFGSSADFGLRAVLKRLRIDPAKDVSILQIGDEPARIAAITSGNIDGTVANAPFGIEAERLKLNIVADSVKMDIPFFNTGLLGSRKYLEKQDAKVMNFLRAYLEAIKILKTEREYSAKGAGSIHAGAQSQGDSRGLRLFQQPTSTGSLSLYGRHAGGRGADCRDEPEGAERRREKLCQRRLSQALGGGSVREKDLGEVAAGEETRRPGDRGDVRQGDEEARR